MTMRIKKEFSCYVCGTKSQQTLVLSTNSMGSNDLDLRAPEMERSTIDSWIHRCPSCNYCSSNLSEKNDDAIVIIESQEYKNIIANKNIPQLASSFLALSFIQQKMNYYSNSARSSIHAAWICDDVKEDKIARLFRMRAIKLLGTAKILSQEFQQQKGATELITIDLMRRAGMYTEALNLVNETKNMEIEEVLIKLVDFQKILINLKDIDAHTISEAIGEK